MADTKISGLTAKATLGDSDLVPIVDIEAVPDETKKITVANVKTQIVNSTTVNSAGAVMNSDGLSVSNDGTKTTITGQTGDYNRMGEGGTTSHSLDSENDFMVTGELEVKGASFLDGAVTVGSTVDGRDVDADGTKLDGVVANTQAITHAITDNKTVTVDGTTNAPVNSDYAKWTANGLEGMEKSQILSDLNVADGADVTGSNAPQAHKDSHDPSGSDPLDTAAAPEISVVVAAGEGTAETFARSDHIHAINHAITDNHLLTVDGTINSGEYLKATANGAEGKTLAEVLADLSGDAGAAFDWNSQNLTGIAALDAATGDLNIIGETAGTDDVQTLLRIDRTTSGTAADTFGSAIEWHLENDNGDLHEAAKLEVTLWDITQNTEDSLFRFHNHDNGTSRQTFQLASTSSQFTRWLVTQSASAQATAYYEIKHADSSAGLAGEAVSFIGKLPDSAGNQDFVARVNFGWTTATSGSEEGFVALTSRSGGADTYAANEVCRWDGEHNMGMNVTAWGTNANTVFAIANGTIPADSIADGIQMYSEDDAGKAEFKARDEDGNVATLTPHPDSIMNTLPVDADHIYPYVSHYTNDYLGKEIWVDMELLAREVERLGGKTLVHIIDRPKRDWEANQENIRLQVEAERTRIQENIDTYTALRDNAPSAKKEADYQEIIDQLTYTLPESYVKKSMPQWIKQRITKEPMEA